MRSGFSQPVREDTRRGQTKTAMAIAELCYQTLLEEFGKAMAACEAKVVHSAH